MIDEGYVKFRAEWLVGPVVKGIDVLVDARNRLHALGLIGEYADSRIGFGNISMRSEDQASFVISGSATGGIPVATAAHFCRVLSYSVGDNAVSCEGPVTASSESLTHAMLYDCAPWVGAVVHVHHQKFWEFLLLTAPCSGEGIAYGTPEMALEMKRLMRETDLPNRRILAMTGHFEGVIAIGSTIGEAMKKLLEEYEKIEGGLEKPERG